MDRRARHDSTGDQQDDKQRQREVPGDQWSTAGQDAGNDRSEDNQEGGEGSQQQGRSDPYWPGSKDRCHDRFVRAVHEEYGRGQRHQSGIGASAGPPDSLHTRRDDGGDQTAGEVVGHDACQVTGADVDSGEGGRQRLRSRQHGPRDEAVTEPSHRSAVRARASECFMSMHSIATSIFRVRIKLSPRRVSVTRRPAPGSLGMPYCLLR